MKLDSRRIVIIGCGDIGKRVAKLAMAKEAEVFAMARNEEKGELLCRMGIKAIIGDLDNPETIKGLPVAGSILFYFAPPPGGGFIDTRVRNFSASLDPEAAPEKVIYISTSGVYGDCGGAMVTENTPVNPQTARAKRRLDAETTLLQWGNKHGVAVVILRVTGIYGPGRLPVQHLAAGQPLLLASEAPYTNRIHADDLARICIAAAEKGAAGEIFNVSDGNESTMTEYFTAVAEILGFPPPRQVTMAEARETMSPLMLSYVSESRRMDNSKMLSRLGVKLLYPTLSQGLRASLETQGETPEKG
jgi:nucleoside-diphosphate-sugar epimerase